MSKESIGFKIPLLSISIVLTIVFSILKFAGVITWSWWLVFCPILFTGIFILLQVLFIGIFLLIMSFFLKKLS
jgi:hypothetical protein